MKVCILNLIGRKSGVTFERYKQISLIMILFSKHLHVSLATKSRLAMFNITNNNACNLCNEGNEQTNLHMFYECTYIVPFYQ